MQFNHMYKFMYLPPQSHFFNKYAYSFYFFAGTFYFLYYNELFIKMNSIAFYSLLLHYLFPCYGDKHILFISVDLFDYTDRLKKLLK